MPTWEEDRNYKKPDGNWVVSQAYITYRTKGGDLTPAEWNQGLYHGEIPEKPKQKVQQPKHKKGKLWKTLGKKKGGK